MDYIILFPLILYSLLATDVVDGVVVAGAVLMSFFVAGCCGCARFVFVVHLAKK
jgi:hypothetical protein